METRRKDLSQLQSYIEGIDKEVTMILQSLQWDRKHLLESSTMVACKYDLNHRVPSDRLKTHERVCLLKSLGYSEEDAMLSDPADPEADTLVTLGLDDIKQIITEASKSDPLFRTGTGCPQSAPLTLARLQTTYTPDERRAIHDAVVNAVPSCHELADLALPSAGGDNKQSREKSRVEILAELRDTKRRRAKYRGAAKTRNYSDVLRDVITTQMEYYSDSQAPAPPADSQVAQVTSQQSEGHSGCGDNDNAHADTRESRSQDTEHHREGKEKRKNTRERQEHGDYRLRLHEAKEKPSRSKSRYVDEYESKSERYHRYHHDTKNYNDNKYKQERISSVSKVKSNRNEKHESRTGRSHGYGSQKRKEGSSRDRKGHKDTYDHEVNKCDRVKQTEYTKGRRGEKHKRYDTDKLEGGSEVYSYEKRKRRRDC